MKFFCYKHELSNFVGSMKTLFENIMDFKFYHLHFMDLLLLKDFENKVEVTFESLKWIFVQLWNLFWKKSNLNKLRKILLLAIYLYYHILFKEWFLKFFILSASLQRTLAFLLLNHVIDRTLFYHLPFKKLLEEMVFEEECRKFYNLGNFVSTFPHLNCEVVEILKSKFMLHFQMLLISFGMCILSIIILLKRSYFKLLTVVICFLSVQRIKASILIYLLRMLVIMLSWRNYQGSCS